jgi:hypothetical protein
LSWEGPSLAPHWEWVAMNVSDMSGENIRRRVRT